MLTLSDIAIAQINLTVGDIEGNLARIRKARETAQQLGAKLVVLPELAVCGYPPEDLILKPVFRVACAKALAQLALDTKHGPAMLVGTIHEQDGKCYNSAALLAGGQVQAIQHKVRLPNYGVFDERRVFCEGEMPAPMEFEGVKLGVLVCEDLWTVDVARHLAQQGAQMLLALNASPFEFTKHERRLRACSRNARETNLPFIYVNCIGGQDDIIFDGASFMLDEKGKVACQFPSFGEQVALTRELSTAMPPREETIYSAITLGLRDYVLKNGFTGVLLGLSGGIDSALVAAIAVDALGAENVTGVLLPSPYTSNDSNEDALETARLLGIRTTTIPIGPSMQLLEQLLPAAFEQAGKPAQGDWMEDVSVGGNAQARLRGLLLMALSNQTGRMLLSTSNKSEVAVGYSTLYGDMCGGYAPLKDVYKTMVYTLANWRNGRGRVIPERSITKAPTAELKPGQTDQDQLPSYDLLDVLLERLVEKRESLQDLLVAGFERQAVEKVVQLLRNSEYKRRQSPPGPKVTPMLFGRDRRYPLTNKFKG